MFEKSECILWYSLRNARPDGSVAIDTLTVMLESLAMSAFPTGTIHRDEAQNLWIDARGNGERTLFMAHLDTVERSEYEKDIFIREDGRIHSPGHILGADDGAGIGILASMMEMKIPALYLFSQGEEIGGYPARWIAENAPDSLADIDRCISFDRKGTGEICGDQCVGTLASVAFVNALSDGLGMAHGWGHGSYTDNSEFQGLVPEIVNVSVGYYDNHGINETLDWNYFQDLRLACVSMAWETLPTIGPDRSADFQVESWLHDNYSLGIPSGLDHDLDLEINDAVWDIADIEGNFDESFTDAVKEILNDMVARIVGAHDRK
jgi:hypothetical protein